MRHVLWWQNWSGEGLEHTEVREAGDAYLIDGVVIGRAGADRFATMYRLCCDDQWRVREAEVRVIGTVRSLLLRSDGRGRWTDREGRALDELSGCVDIDISATPLTNTLPIRRLQLKENEAATIRVAYVSVPTLVLTVNEQRYTRLHGRQAYRFEVVGGEFCREIDVDSDGFVIDYPGLFRRIL